jgi:hypothetical protein
MPRPTPLISLPTPRTVPQLEVNKEKSADAMRRMMMRLCFWIMMGWSLWLYQQCIFEFFLPLSRELYDW